MRRLLICLCCVCLLTALSACTAPPQPVPEPVQPTPPLPGDNGPGLEGPGRPAPLLARQPQPELEFYLTAEPARYAPTATIVPLTSARRIYTNCVLGETTFIYVADQTRLELPPNLFGYQPVCAEEDNAVIAYALLNEDNLMAFMSMSGRLLTDFVYYAFGEDTIHFPNRYGYLVVAKPVLDHAGETIGLQYGLLNLANGEEVIAPQYDTLWPLKYALLAQQDGNYQLLDYAGALLFDFGAKQPELRYDVVADDGWYYYFSGSGYTYLADTGELFRHDLPQDYSIQYYGGMTIMVNHNADRDDQLTVYDQWGEICFEGSAIRDYYLSGAAVLVTSAASLVDIITPGEHKQLEIPRLHSEENEFLEYGGEDVLYKYADENDYDLIHAVRYNVIKYAEPEPELVLPDEYRRYPLPGTDYFYRVRFEPSYSQQLEDADGAIIVPFGEYGYLTPYPPFIIGASEENSDPAFDILNMQGEVLLSNPLGAIVRECGLTDAIVVWLDAKTCVFLHADGSITQIENPPQVEREYLGG